MSSKKSSISSNDVSITPNGKKLIQARLPFKTLATSPKVGIDAVLTGDSRKRKLSSHGDDNRSTKLSRTSVNVKENIEKTDEVTVQEMVDLVENTNDSLSDVAAKDDDKPPTVDLTKSAKKSTQSANLEEKQVLLRRSNRKCDFEGSTKVVIKIPSSKKKKLNERQDKVKTALKIDEDDDGDIVPFDSEENSLTSVDDKDKSINDKIVDLNVILIDDDSSFTVDDKATNSKEDVNKANEETAESDDSHIGKETNLETKLEAKKVSEINKGTNKLDQSEVGKEKNLKTNVEVTNVSEINQDTKQVEQSEIFTLDEEENASSGSDNTDDEKQSVQDVEKSLTDVNQKKLSSLEQVVVDQVDVTEDTDFDESKMSPPTTTTTSEKPLRKYIDNSGLATTPKTPSLKVSDDKALTPKQLQRKLDSEQKRLAKEKAKEDRDRKLQEAKEERERKLQEEKELRQKERDEKERQRKKERDDKEEQKRKEREDKEELRRKEKEEREKKKQAEIDAKNEEKKQKEEEKRLKEEEKLAKEEAEIKKKRKEAEAFTKFFAKKSNKSTESDKMDADDLEIKLNFMPFRIKDDMRLAPIVRRKLSPTSKTKFDGLVLNCTNNCSETDLYIQSLRNGDRISKKQGKTWPVEDTSEDLMIVDDLEGATAIEEASSIQKYRAKFFKFEENRRPPYYGTWQKKSSLITPRRPFVTDSKFFDYEIDSDDEWEDEEPGESLHGSDDEKDKESDDDYDIDNEFFVPHGHLSDEELANNDDVDDDNSPDTQKAKLKIMQKVFSDEMKKKTEKIKPRLIGLIWQNKDGSQPQVCPNVIWDMLQLRSMIFNGPCIAIPITPSTQKSDSLDETGDGKKNVAVKKRRKITEDGVTDLIRLIYGNTNNSDFLSKEFRAFTAQKNKDNDTFQEFSLTSIRHKIKELAEWKPCPEEGPLMNKFCWYVTPETRNHYNMKDLPIINDWNYILPPKTKTKTDVKKAKDNDKEKHITEATDEVSTPAKTPKSKLGNIAKFAKVLTDDDKKKKFAISVQEPLDASSIKSKSETEPSPKPVKKRVKLLMSGPRGQDIPAQTKNSLISQYLSSSANVNKKSTDDEPICID